MRLSGKAVAFIDGSMDSFNTGDYYVGLAVDALKLPGDSFWRDEDLWVTHTMMFATPDRDLTDDYLYDWSNYETVLAHLEALFPGDVEACTFGSWTYSRFVAVKVRVLNKRGNVTAAFVEACRIADAIKDYPIWDEQHYMDLEYEVQQGEIERFAQDLGVAQVDLWEAIDAGVLYYEGFGSGFTVQPTEYSRAWYSLDWREREDELRRLIREVVESVEVTA